MTSTTTPTGAAAASSGVKATCTTATTLTSTSGRTSRDHLLPAPRSRHRPLLLGVRPPDLHRVHDDGAGRDPLPGALRPGTGRRACEPGRPPRQLRGDR